MESATTKDTFGIDANFRPAKISSFCPRVAHKANLNLPPKVCLYGTLSGGPSFGPKDIKTDNQRVRNSDLRESPVRRSPGTWQSSKFSNPLEVRWIARFIKVLTDFE